MAAVIYIDSLYGNDANPGTLVQPVRTLAQGYSLASRGTVLVLQEGDSSSYGSLTIQKDVAVRSAHGARAKVGTLTIQSAQCLLENLTFDGLTEGIIVTNTSIGATAISNCRFENVNRGIQLSGVNYISIHRNYFSGHDYGILIYDAQEVLVNSNIFDQGKRSIEIVTVERLDLWRNTIYGASAYSPVTSPDENLRVIYKTLTSTNIANKRFGLPTYATQNSYGYDVALNVVNGPSFHYGVDYTVTGDGTIVSWDGLRLEDEFAVNDLVRVMYSEAADPGGAEAIRAIDVGDENSTIDSNNIVGTDISNIALGVFINEPLRLRFNNFHKTDIWYQGTASSDVGNFSDDPQFVDPNNADFRLQVTSPDINAGDPDRWDKILTDMGIGNYGGYTSISPITRVNEAYFGREIDFTGVHRYALGPSGDVGAWEYNQNASAAGTYVGEDGYDFAYPGSETAPYATVDRAYNRSPSSDISVGVYPVPIMDGPTGPITAPVTGPEIVRYGRYRSEDLVLGSGKMNVGMSSKNDIAFIRSSYPRFETGMVYVAPDGDDASGTGSSVSPYRTIQRALVEGYPFILIRPGYYPTFTGDANKTLIGVEETKTISYDNTHFVNLLNGGWTGPSGYTVTRNTVTLNGSSSVMGEFTFLGDYEVKYNATCGTDSFTGRIVNADNQVYVTYDRSIKRLKIGYYTDGSYYSYNYDLSSQPITGALTDVKTTTTLSGNRASVRVNNSYIAEYVQFDMGTGYTGPWTLLFTADGVGESKAQDVRVMTEQLSGATGINSTKTQQRIFGIMGVTGIMGYSGIK